MRGPRDSKCFVFHTMPWSLSASRIIIKIDAGKSDGLQPFKPFTCRLPLIADKAEDAEGYSTSHQPYFVVVLRCFRSTLPTSPAR